MSAEARAVGVQAGERTAVVRMLHALGLVTCVPLPQALRSLTPPPPLKTPETMGGSWRWTCAAPFLDAAGLRVLAEGRKALRDAGRGLVVLVRPGSQPRTKARTNILLACAGGVGVGLREMREKGTLPSAHLDSALVLPDASVESLRKRQADGVE